MRVAADYVSRARLDRAFENCIVVRVGGNFINLLLRFHQLGECQYCWTDLCQSSNVPVELLAENPINLPEDLFRNGNPEVALLR